MNPCTCGCYGPLISPSSHSTLQLTGFRFRCNTTCNYIVQLEFSHVCPSPARVHPQKHTRTHSHGPPLWVISPPRHTASSSTRPLPLLPLHPHPPLHLRDRWVSGGACRLVPSDQLPLISCPSSSLPPSISTHMAPSACDSRANRRLKV